MVFNEFVVMEHQNERHPTGVRRFPQRFATRYHDIKSGAFGKRPGRKGTAVRHFFSHVLRIFRRLGVAAYVASDGTIYRCQQFLP